MARLNQQKTQPFAMPDPNTQAANPVPTPAPKPSVKMQVFQAVSDAFPGKNVSVIEYELGNPKLGGGIVPHIGVKVQLSFPAGSFAVAGRVPETADDAAIAQLIGRLKADALKHEAILTPRVAI